MNHDQHIANIRATLPEPGTDPMQHARHTLAAYADTPDDEFVVTATWGVYGEYKTGLTWGDLRDLAQRAESSPDEQR